jgi:dTMP kinase
MLEKAQSRFISVEGGEGVGKSTFIRALADRFKDRGIPLAVTREPGGTKVADLIRHVFSAPIPDEPLFMGTEALLVSAARCQHVEWFVKPRLKDGVWVLSDRFADSTRVYQGIIGGIDDTTLEGLISFSTSGVAPDLTFLLDCSVDITSKRLSGRREASVTRSDEISRYDQQNRAFHERLRLAYQSLARKFPERIVVLDAALAPEAVLAQAWQVLETRFG